MTTAIRSHATRAAFALLAATAVALVLAQPVRAATHQVNIQGFAFVPASQQATVGDTVTWTNSDDVPHTATSLTGAFDSDNLASGATYSFVFATAGTFEYRCDIHPNMLGTITVVAAQGGGASPTTTGAAPTTTGAAPTTAGSAPTARPPATGSGAASGDSADLSIIGLSAAVALVVAGSASLVAARRR